MSQLPIKLSNEPQDWKPLILDFIQGVSELAIDATKRADKVLEDMEGD